MLGRSVGLGLWLSQLGWRGAAAVAIDNEVVSSAVQCTADSIMVQFETREDFEGRIFVKGMVENPGCVQSYSEGGGGGGTRSPTMAFLFGECRMQRARTLSPQRGMMQSLVVIISFHSTFVTKVDRAYRVQCFYMEAEKTLTAGLEVSMLTTEDLRDTGAMPTCAYSVHKGSVDGPIVRFATVGEEVYHKWLCESDSHNVLVKSCYVDDGQANRYDVIDERGCSIDPVIMGELDYATADGQVLVSVEAHVFKFADRPNVFFQCTVQLCSRNQPECAELSPPQCQTRHRQFQLRRRSKRAMGLMAGNASAAAGPPLDGADEMDLFSELISVADLEDSLQGALAQPAGEEEVDRARGAEKEALRDGVCLSATGLGVLLSFIVLVLLMALTVSCLLCIHRHTANPLKPYNVRS